MISLIESDQRVARVQYSLMTYAILSSISPNSASSWMRSVLFSRITSDAAICLGMRRQAGFSDMTRGYSPRAFITTICLVILFQLLARRDGSQLVRSAKDRKSLPAGYFSSPLRRLHRLTAVFLPFPHSSKRSEQSRLRPYQFQYRRSSFEAVPGLTRICHTGKFYHYPVHLVSIWTFGNHVFDSGDSRFQDRAA